MNPDRDREGNDWNTTSYDDDHSFVFEYGHEVVDLLDPKPNERILDLGCGTGHLTDRIASSGVDVVGLDASAEMIEEARENYPEHILSTVPYRRYARSPRPGDYADGRQGGDTAVLRAHD